MNQRPKRWTSAPTDEPCWPLVLDDHWLWLDAELTLLPPLHAASY